MKIHEKVVCGGEVTLKNAGVEIVFGEELKILDFAWGELTLDDTMEDPIKTY